MRRDVVSDAVEMFVFIDETRLVSEKMRKRVGMLFREQEAKTVTHVASSHFVIVTLGQRLFAIDAEAVQGIVDSRGAVNGEAPVFQGRVYHMTDLTSLLALCRAQDNLSAQILLLMKGQMRRSLVVDRVHGRMDLHESQVLSLPPHFQGPERHWYQGMILFEHSVALILNLSWVVQSSVERHQDRSRDGSQSICIEWRN